MFKHRISTLSACMIAVSLVLVGCGNKDEKADAEKVVAAQPQAQEVGVLVAQSQAVETFVELAGRASSYEVSEVRPQATGVILKRLFAEGSFVQAGQPLYELDARSNRAAAENARAAVVRNQANLQALRSKEARYRQLVGTNAISKQDYDDVVSSVRLAEADLAASQASLKSAEIDLGHSVIRAPISGRTSSSSVTVGALVTANQADALVTIQRLHPIYIDINQSSAELLRLRQQISQGNVDYNGNAKVKLTLEDGSQYPAEGQLAFASANVNETTGSITLRAVFPNQQSVLLPGMYATAKISQGVLPHAYLVPQTAVTRTATGDAQVMVVGADNKVAVKKVTTVGTQDTNWIINSGLADGDKIIVKGNAKVKEGTLVKATATTLADLQEATPATPKEATDSATSSESTTSSEKAPATQATAESQKAEQTTETAQPQTSTQ